MSKKYSVPIATVRQLVGNLLRTNGGVKVGADGKIYVLVKLLPPISTEELAALNAHARGVSKLRGERLRNLNPVPYTEKELMQTEPKTDEQDPKPITAPWPGEPPTAPPPDTDDGEVKVPLVR